MRGLYPHQPTCQVRACTRLTRDIAIDVAQRGHRLLVEPLDKDLELLRGTSRSL